MKCQNLLSGKNKKNMNLPSAELTQNGKSYDYASESTRIPEYCQQTRDIREDVL